MRDERFFIFEHTCDFRRRRAFHKALGVFERSYQLFDFAAQFRVSGAGVVEKLRAFLRLKLLRGVE